MKNTKTKEQKLPKWFDGLHYPEGETVVNPFSNEEFYLNRTELSIYDLIKGTEHIFGMHQATQPNKPLDPKLLKDFERALSWFRKYSPKAYMVLLD